MGIESVAPMCREKAPGEQSVLQQWNAVKKNKLGSRQERIIGIDGKCIYNSSPGAIL